MKDHQGGMIAVTLFTMILITQILWTFILCLWQTSIIFQRRENRDEQRDLRTLSDSLKRPRHETSP